MRNENALAGQSIPKFHSPNVQSDEALLKAIAAGDQSAMRTLYAVQRTALPLHCPTGHRRWPSRGPRQRGLHRRMAPG
jgi:hypothetical protein